MRVVRDSKGQYVVDDEPMKLGGRAAEKFLAGMSEREAQSSDPAREKFLAECRDIYDTSKKATA